MLIHLATILIFIAGHCTAQQFDLQLRTSYFIPQDGTFRSTFQNGWEDFQIEASYDQCWECVPWVNVSYYEQTGKSSCEKKYTRITSGSLTAGAKKYFCPWDCWKPYLGVGVGVDYKVFHDKASYVNKHLTKWCPTLILKSGLERDIGCNWFINCYLDYSYTQIFGKSCKDGIRQRSCDAGGLFAGVGVGMRI